MKRGISAIACVLAISWLSMPTQAAAAPPPSFALSKPPSDVTCYFALSMAAGLLKGFPTETPSKSNGKPTVESARLTVKFVQQWYLARISTWPNERWAAENTNQIKDRIYNIPIKSKVQIATSCIDWAIPKIRSDLEI